jgi:phosphatidylglycerophosphatase A
VINPLKRHLLVALSSGLYTGYIPVASGTFGTLVAIVLFYPFRALNTPTWPNGLIFAGVLLAVIVLAIALADAAERLHVEKDSHKIVIDEIAGFFVTMAFVPFRWQTVAAAFLLFRVMDVLKPPPIFRLQLLPGGWGIVVDDVLAGLYACLILHGLVGLSIL